MFRRGPIEYVRGTLSMLNAVQEVTVLYEFSMYVRTGRLVANYVNQSLLLTEDCQNTHQLTDGALLLGLSCQYPATSSAVL